MARQSETRKQVITYYFSVEGETELWYLKWLENQINGNDASLYKVKLDAQVQKDPVTYAKKLVVQKKTVVWHLCDLEGSTSEHIQEIQGTIGRLKSAKALGKDIDYQFGYSNLSFDLWMVLHKQNCNTELDAPGRYLPYINRGYGESFESMNKFKQEANFKRCLAKLSLDNVREAIRKAKEIMRRNAVDEYPLTVYKGYHYYLHNPALEIWQPIELILKKCGIS